MSPSNSELAEMVQGCLETNPGYQVEGVTGDGGGSTFRFSRNTFGGSDKDCWAAQDSLYRSLKRSLSHDGLWFGGASFFPDGVLEFRFAFQP